ncbi:hypothetical protein CRM22_003282 [Opisthorchis felineus]|uniref:Uncharacterized protein n=1 Tax=Opisthorchis felineus TaxID=147828 RepID=A0A4S2M2M3_OPIFE|nr:hypothetical protein CRM22_003282 [Opisthorchis felineus]
MFHKIGLKKGTSESKYVSSYLLYFTLSPQKKLSNGFLQEGALYSGACVPHDALVGIFTTQTFPVFHQTEKVLNNRGALHSLREIKLSVAITDRCEERSQTTQCYDETRLMNKSPT